MSGRISIKLPQYNQRESIEANFERFFEWALGLVDPAKDIIEASAKAGFETRIHPLGFRVVYLSPRDKGLETAWLTGVARADIYPPGARIKDDIHSHGFSFVSGVVAGRLTNVPEYPDFSQAVVNGEGYIGYETRVDAGGNNHLEQVTDATVAVSHFEPQELMMGETYGMGPKNEFHHVKASDAVTLVCKTPSDELSLVLRKPDDLVTAVQY